MSKPILKIESIATLDELALRELVFVQEQGVTIEEEHCDDESLFLHLNLYCDSELVACCRLSIQKDIAHIGRVAVRREYRKRGFGSIMMKHAHDYARMKGCTSVEISAQISAFDFYKKLGYVQFGDKYLDARILHIDMSLDL